MPTEQEIIEALQEIFDPEIPINIYDLGLIYKIDIQDEGKIHILFTVTSPACPVGDILMDQVKQAIAKLDGVAEVEVELTYDPPWNKEKMTFEGKLQASMLGIQ